MDLVLMLIQPITVAYVSVVSVYYALLMCLVV